jgi:hypothetical protein
MMDLGKYLGTFRFTSITQCYKAREACDAVMNLPETVKIILLDNPGKVLELPESFSDYMIEGMRLYGIDRFCHSFDDHAELSALHIHYDRLKTAA